MSVVLQFPVRVKKDDRLVQALEQLLDEATAGRIVGLAYVTMEPHNEYTADVVGAARSEPAVALSIAHQLVAAVAKLT